MTYSLEDTQERILEYLRSEMAQPVYETAIPEYATLKRNDKGHVVPYIALQFGDLVDAYSETFAGAETGDFWLPIQLQAVSGDATISRKIANKLIRVMLGWNEKYGGQVRKRMGGRQAPVQNADGATAAYVNPTSFGVRIQLFYDV